ncbi:hypothetical protein [Aeromonas veronii]
MMVDLEVMAYFKLSLSTRNWDSAFLCPSPAALLLLCAATMTTRWLGPE